jgi:hypothetical protein
MDMSNLSGAYFAPDIDNIQPSDIKAINVIGREWFDKINGNSYNDFSVVFLTENGEHSFIFGAIEYGYGNYYQQRAKAVLGTLGLRNVPTSFNKKEGCKKRDLFNAKGLKEMKTLSLYDTLRLIGYKPSQEV